MSLSLSRAAEVVDYWRAAGDRGDWFAHRPDFDREFREPFYDLYERAAARDCDDWIVEVEGALALIILLDQYPRNAFRGTARMYATDALARSYARQAIDNGYFERIESRLRLFWCLPFAHSEELADQDLSVSLNSRLGEPWLGHANEHRNIVRRFGRFPHRNAILDRSSTAAELGFLADGGFAG